MVMPDRKSVLTIRIVWLLLIVGIGSSRSQRQIYTENSSNNVTVISPGANIWSRTPRHVQRSNQRPCRLCGDGCDFNEGNLTCRQVSSFTVECLTDCSTFVISLDIEEGRFKTMNESGLLNAEFPSLKRLSIRQSGLNRLESLLNQTENLIELNLSDNRHLSDVQWQNFSRIVRLEKLILVNNNLSCIPNLLSIMNMSSLSTLDLSGNKWECKYDFHWVLELQEKGKKLINGDNWTCQDNSQKESWFKWNYSIIKRETIKKTVAAECLSAFPTSNCLCEFTSKGRGVRESYTVQVDCSNRQMTSLPAQLPNFTSELDVSGNNLTSLDQVIHYGNQSLKILIADSNQIVSIRNLSRSNFIRNFSRLSLRNNFISPYEIPLNDIVEVPELFQVKYLNLYNNSWECDCNMATTVRDWLWKYRHVVNDSSLILCSRGGKKVSVLHLLPTQVCEGNYNDTALLAKEKEKEIFTLHVIIYVEVAAISVVALKFAYDSWRYFRHGQLPWIATKLP